MTPPARTWAKSRTRRRRRLAIRGVPLARLAISAAPASSMGTPKMPALRVTIWASSAGVYSSKRSRTPKRSRKGAESCPARVVAPMRVKWGRSKRIELAEGPLPMMMSMAKSSMAGYKISSTDRFRRWISSTKRMSFSLRLVSSAARSPGFSMAGPEVTRRLTPISLAMMPESVVLPRPGGPWSSTWSRGSPRSLAASMKIERFSLAFSWPMYSVSFRGRRDSSPSSSPRWAVDSRGCWVSS